MKQPKTVNLYPQLQSHISCHSVSTLCIACKHLTDCKWIDKQEPIENWKAIPTICDAVCKYSSYKVLECPNFTHIEDYYDTKGDFTRLLAKRAMLSVSSISKYSEISLKAWKIYSKKYPRSIPMREEDRTRVFSKIFRKLLSLKKEKEKRERMKKRNELRKERMREAIEKRENNKNN